MPLTIASSIFLARYKSLGVEETPVSAVSNLIDDIGLKVDVERPRHVLAGGGLREKGAEAIIVGRWRALHETTVGLRQPSAWNHATRMEDTHAETMLNSVELPCVVITFPVSFCAYKDKKATRETLRRVDRMYRYAEDLETAQE